MNRNAICFYTVVSDENNCKHSIEVLQDLVGEYPINELTPQEALSKGIELSSYTTAEGARAFSDEKILQLRLENQKLCASDVDNNSSDLYVETLESLHDKAAGEILGLSQAVKFYEDVEHTCPIQDPVLPINTEEAVEEVFALHTLVPVIEQFPAEMLSEPQIYQPAPIDNRRYQTHEIVEAPKANSLAVSISQNLISRYKIRAYQGELYLFAEDEGIYKRLSSQDLDYLINEHFGDQIKKTGDVSNYRNAQEFLKKEHSLVIYENNFLPTQLWAFRNGFHNIYTGAHFANDGRYFLRNVLHCQFDASATCPVFDTYISSISAGDYKLILLIWEVVGYLLSTDTNGKVLFAFVGKKDTGKSLLANVISNIVGMNSISHLSANEFAGKFDVAELNGKHINICMDLPDRPLSPEAVGKIKSITGNDMIRSDVKYKDSICFKPTARLLFGSNSLIRTELPDQAFNDRLITIPFRYPVPKEKQDFNLERKLASEFDGICNKAMKYYINLRDRGYIFTVVDSFDMQNEAFDHTLIIKDFADEHCIFTDDEADKVSTEDLYAAFTNFCYDKDIVLLSKNEFTLRFKKIFLDFVEKKKVKIGKACVNGFTKLKTKI